MSHLHFYSATLPDNEANGSALSVQFWTTEISKPYKGTSLTCSTQHLPVLPPRPALALWGMQPHKHLGTPKPESLTRDAKRNQVKEYT